MSRLNSSPRLEERSPSDLEMDSPEFTEFGIKIRKLRLTFKLRRRQRRNDHFRQIPSILPSNEDPSTLINDLSDTVLRTLDLDSSPRSRAPISTSTTNTTNANMEFTGFYTAPPSVTSSGYGSSISTSSEVYSEVYSESHTLTTSPPPPPLPPRGQSSRAPARPPYPSSIVRVVQEISEPITR